MVSRGETPALDRRISIELTTTRTVTEALTYRWDWRSGGVDAGEYDISSRRRRFPELGGPTDADGLAIPGPDAFPVGSALTFTWDTETLATTILAATNVDQYGQRGDNLHLELDAQLDAFDTPLTLSLPATTREVTTTEPVKLWARREVLAATDQIQLSNDSRLNINLAKYTVRYDSRIKADQTLTDENGFARTVLGVQPLDRRRFMEVLAERIS